MLHVIELPVCFYDDHSARMSDKDPSEPAYSDRVLKRKGALYVVEACEEALREILDDAEYYASMRAGVDMEKDMFGVIMSAKATVKRIKAYRQSLAQAPQHT